MANLLETAISLQPLVRAHADASEAQRHLSREVAQAFAEAGLYRIAGPRDSLGSEQTPATQVEVIEAIAYADGSAAWNLMIGIETFGLLSPAFANCIELIEPPATVLCSSTAAVGRADKVAGGYRVSGQWQFVSGCHNAHFFGATVRVWEGGEMLESVPNQYAIVDRDDFEVVPLAKDSKNGATDSTKSIDGYAFAHCSPPSMAVTHWMRSTIRCAYPQPLSYQEMVLTKCSSETDVARASKVLE